MNEGDEEGLVQAGNVRPIDDAIVPKSEGANFGVTADSSRTQAP